MRKTEVFGGQKAIVWANPKLEGRTRDLEAEDRVRGFIPELLISKYAGHPSIELYDLATAFAHVDPNVRIGWTLIQSTGQLLNRAGNRTFVNGYLEMDSEVQFHFGTELRRILSSYLLNDPFGSSLTTLGNRRVPNRWPLHHNCGNLFLDLYLIADKRAEDQPTSRKFVLQNGTRGWVLVIPVSRRLADFELIRDLISLESSQQVLDIEQRLKDEADEEWLSYQTGIVYQKDGQLRPNLLPGQYSLKLDSPFYYEPFDLLDRVNYKFTREPRVTADEVEPPRVSTGRGTRSSAQVFMVPQYWKCVASFKVWYIFFTWWAFTFVVIPFTFTFENRFPLFPNPWSLGTGVADLPKVWNWIERSSAHSRLYGQIHALEFFTPFMGMVFFFTSDGIFEIRRTNTFADSLVAVVQVGNRQYYCWRRLSTNRDLTIVIGGGELNTYLINSWGAELIGGTPDNPGGLPI